MGKISVGSKCIVDSEYEPKASVGNGAPAHKVLIAAPLTEKHPVELAGPVGRLPSGIAQLNSSADSFFRYATVRGADCPSASNSASKACRAPSSFHSRSRRMISSR